MTREKLLLIKNPYEGQIETVNDECNCGDLVTFKYINGVWIHIYKPDYKECWEMLKLSVDDSTRVIMDNLETGRL